MAYGKVGLLQRAGAIISSGLQQDGTMVHLDDRCSGVVGVAPGIRCHGGASGGGGAGNKGVRGTGRAKAGLALGIAVRRYCTALTCWLVVVAVASDVVPKYETEEGSAAAPAPRRPRGDLRRGLAFRAVGSRPLPHL